MQLRARVDVVMASSSYTAEFGSGVVVNGLDLNPDATKVLVGGRKGRAFVLAVFAVLLTKRGIFVYKHIARSFNVNKIKRLVSMSVCN